MKRNRLHEAPLILLGILALLVVGQIGHAATVTGRDGRFIAYDDGTVLDTRTNLMWPAKDNGNNLNWFHAKTFTESFRGGRVYGLAHADRG